jgi:DNA-binding MarR family transcriptional regulator
MTLEESIRQGKPFVSQEEKAVVNLMYTYGWVSSQIQAMLKEHGLSLQQYNILRILRGQQGTPAPLTLIKDRMLDKQSDVSRLIERLIAKNMVIRKICPGDRRKVDVVISEEALELLNTIDENLHVLRAITQKLNIHELAELNRLLDKLRS